MTQTPEPFTFDEMMRMFIHWDEQSRAMFSDDEYVYALECLNSLASEFGRPWVEHLAGVRRADPSTIIDANGNDNVGDGARGIMRALRFYKDWNTVKGFPNAEKLNEKLKKSYDDNHVDLEIHVASGFAMCSAELEFEPEISNGKVSDFRAKAEDESWLYVEVSKRVFRLPQLENDIQRLLDLCLGIVTGQACSLHIFGTFSIESFILIEDWLLSLQGQNTQEAVLKDVAEFRSFPHGYGVTPEIFSSRSPPLQFNSKGDRQNVSFATIFYYVPDPGFANKLSDERKQLPADGNGIIVLDVTGIAGGLAHWQAEAIIALRCAENAHVLAVILLARVTDNEVFPRWKFDAALVLNPSRQLNSGAAVKLTEQALQGLLARF